MRLEDGLAEVGRLGIDTSAVIYLVEQHPRYHEVVREIFRAISTGRVLGITSVVTLSEVLVQPFERGNIRLAEQYREVLLRSANLQTLPISASAAEKAASLRARYRLRTPDAMQVAVAIEAGCDAFLTNDSQLSRVQDLRILILAELEV